MTFSQLNDGVDGKGGIEKGVVAVNVDGDAGGARGSKGTPPWVFTLTDLD